MCCLVYTKRIFVIEKANHTAIKHGLTTDKTRQQVVSRETDDVVRVDVKFETS